jgi:hypothetical protein
MKTTHLTNRCSNTTAPQFCRELIDALGKLKARLVARYEQALPSRGQIIRQAVAEAEELAWRTPFPHLFLPDFAEVRLAEIFATPQPAFARAA